MTQNNPPQGRERTRPEIAVVAFTSLYLLIALIAALATGKSEFVFYLVVMLVLIGAVLILHRRMQLPGPALWGLSIWGLLHLTGGLMPIPDTWLRQGESNVLYNLWLIPQFLKFDQLVHAYGFGLVTWITWIVLKKLFRQSGVEVKPTLGLLIICMGVGMGMGAANEVVEFAATLILPNTNVGGYANTGWDLVSNFVGCLLAAILILLFDRRW